MSWGGDIADPDDDDSDDQEDNISDFPKIFEKAVRGSGSPTDISEKDLNRQINQIDDEDLLREGWLQLNGGPEQGIIEGRIQELDGDIPGDNSDEDESDDSKGGGWGGTPENEVAEQAEESAQKAAKPAIESVDEMEDGDEPDDSETDSAASESRSAPPTPSSSASPGEILEKDRRWKVLVWGPPKTFKTHFCHTMPEPIAYIDTEGKVGDVTKKFADKEIQYWQPKNMTADPDTKFRRAKKALREAIDWLDWYRTERGEIGTIVVDSVSLMWEWAQVHHKLENYPIKSQEEGVENIELSANFKSSQESDWAAVKEYHNGEFREVITDSPYHFCWTAMERVAFEDTLDDDENRQIMEPRGEPNNDYKVDTEIRARKNRETGKVGDLIGSNYIDNMFVGLQRPTYPKVRDAIAAIEQAEASDDPASRSELADEIDAEAIITYDPQIYLS